MRRSFGLDTFGVLAAVMVLAGAARAATQTYVSLAGRDDAIPKLGRPAIALSVDAPDENEAAFLTTELSRELAQQVHTRRLAPGESGDYDLRVTIEAARAAGPVVTIPFLAILTSGGGEPIWRIEGRTDVEGAPLDAAVFAGIGRNVVSALIHDGWVQPRYDPDNPPPPPPRIRTD
jgi:hypothetical protein